MIGTILLWVLFVFLGLLVLLLLVPVVVYADYRGGAFTLKVRVLFVKLTLLPMKKKTPAQQAKQQRKAEQKKQRQEAKKDKKPEGEKAAEKKPPKPPRSVSEWIELIKRLASSGSVAVRFILRNLYVRGVELVLPVHAEDAGDTAIETGKMQALVGGARAVLQNAMHIQYKRLVILPDFTGMMQQELTFACKVLASPVIMIAAAIVGLRRYLVWGRKPKAYRQELRRRAKAAKKARKQAYARAEQIARQRREMLAKEAAQAERDKSA